VANDWKGIAMNSQPTKYAFLMGVAYFCCMAVAHFFSIKVPILFVYYDTPFYAYQDKIISFAVCAYVALFYGAARHRDVARYAIVVLGLTVLGLSAVNLSGDLASVMTQEQSTTPYWIQTAAIGLYVVVLVVLYLRDGKTAAHSGGEHGSPAAGSPSRRAPASMLP
jgi:hypothetical protein